MIVTSNKVFGDDIVAAAMIDRLVHHAEVIALKGESNHEYDELSPRRRIRHTLAATTNTTNSRRDDEYDEL